MLNHLEHGKKANNGRPVDPMQAAMRLQQNPEFMAQMLENPVPLHSFVEESGQTFQGSSLKWLRSQPPLQETTFLLFSSQG